MELGGLRNLFGPNEISWSHVRASKVGFWIFAFLLMIHARQLANPPYWDDILGLHAQAVFLARNHFDLKLLWENGVFWEGGAHVYRWGILHYPLALLYLIFSPWTVHVIWHLFNLLCVSATGALMFSLLCRVSCTPLAALLWVTVALFNPLSLAMAASLGMEPSAALAGMIVVTLVCREKFAWALFAVAAGSLVKLTMVTVALALSVYLTFRAFRGPRRMKVYALASWVISGAMVLLTLLESDGAERGSSVLRTLFPKIWLHGTMFFPATMFCAILLLAAWVVMWVRHRRALKEEYFLLLTVSGFFGAYFLSAVPLPRYAFFVVFPLTTALAMRVSDLVTVRNARFIAAGLSLLTGVFSIPFITRELPPWWRMSGEFLERDCRYLNDLEQNRRICRELEEKLFDAPIVAKWPFVQMLTMPEMGYVKRPLAQVYSGGTVPKYASTAGRFDREKGQKTDVFILFVPNTFEFFSDFGGPLNPRKGDRIVRVWGNSCLYLPGPVLQKTK